MPRHNFLENIIYLHSSIKKILIMRKIFLPIFLAATVLFVASCGSNETKDSTEAAQDKNEQKMDQKATPSNTKDDQDFLVEAASGGLMEVELGKIAATNAASPKVKEFGQQMVTDHSKANDELKALAASKNITIPTTPGEEHQKHIDELKNKKGADFDKAYMSMMVDDHEEDVKKFDNEANKGNDAEIKSFASRTVPTLRHHLEMSKAIHDGMKDK
jgi:putative membrane protein